MQRKELEIIRAGDSHKWWTSARLLLGMTDEQATALHTSLAMYRDVKGDSLFETAVITENYDDLLQILFKAADVALIARAANEGGNSLKKMGISARQMSRAMKAVNLMPGKETTKRIMGSTNG